MDQIQEIHKRVGGGPNFQRSVEKALLGAIVITRYNNQTYRYLLVQCSRVRQNFRTILSKCLNLKCFYIIHVDLQ